MRANEIPDLTYANNRLKSTPSNLIGLSSKMKFFSVISTMILEKLNINSSVYQNMWNETIYRVHNSMTGGHIGMTRATEEFRKRFYFPGFSEFLVSAVKNCLTCPQLKNASSKHQTPPLQPLSSLQSYPGDLMQIDIVGPLKSLVYKFVLTGIDVFSKILVRSTNDERKR